MKAEYIDHMGDDLRVVNAARVSFKKESKSLDEKDVRLLKYLADHHHWTPFSHPQITMREKVPVFIARQRFKHTVGFTYNEVSRRYVDDEPEFFMPKEWRSRPEGSMKQGSGSGTPNLNKVLYTNEWFGDWVLGEELSEYYDNALWQYQEAIAAGVCPEQARMVLPQGMYTEYYVTGSLEAWARAYRQRSDSHAQKEIQDLASQWDEIIRPLFPESWKVLV